jgi:hypothetical protein
MTRRRQFGSVRRLPSGRWQARYWNVTGRLVTARRTFATKADAGRWLSAAESDQARGVWVDPKAGRVRLKSYAEEWLASHARISPRTREIYESQLRLHILPRITEEVPALGEGALGDLTPELVRAWYGALLRARGRSAAAKAYTDCGSSCARR